MRLFAIGLALVLSGAAIPALAAAPCPPEVAEAKAALTKAQASLKKATAARGQDVQAPRGQNVQAPRGQDVQAPRGQDVEAPRGQSVQAPRGQGVQAPRGQDIQEPRTQEVQTQSVSKAASLVREAEQACKKGNTSLPSKTVTTMRLDIPALTVPSARKRVRTNCSIGAQKSVPMSTSGNSWVFPVWITVAVSKISSRVPKPPGRAMKASGVHSPRPAFGSPRPAVGSPVASTRFAT